MKGCKIARYVIFAFCDPSKYFEYSTCETTAFTSIIPEVHLYAAHSLTIPNGLYAKDRWSQSTGISTSVLHNIVRSLHFLQVSASVHSASHRVSKLYFHCKLSAQYEQTTMLSSFYWNFNSPLPRRTVMYLSLGHFTQTYVHLRTNISEISGYPLPTPPHNI